jgi:hypothetical protein
VSGETGVKVFLRFKQDFVGRDLFSEEQASVKEGSATLSHYDCHRHFERGFEGDQQVRQF